MRGWLVRPRSPCLQMAPTDGPSQWSGGSGIDCALEFASASMAGGGLLALGEEDRVTSRLSWPGGPPTQGGGTNC